MSTDWTKVFIRESKGELNKLVTSTKFATKTAKDGREVRTSILCRNSNVG
jgi:hypothetical protein